MVRNFSRLILLALAITGVLAVQSLTGEIGRQIEEPLISDCDTVNVQYGDINPAWPGNDFEIPVTITNTDTIIGMDLYVSYPNGLEFVGIDTSGCPWDPDSIIVDHDTAANTVNIDFRIRGGAVPPTGDYTRFTDLQFTVPPSSDFDFTYYVGFGNRVDIRMVDDIYNDCEVNDTTGSTVTIPDDSVTITLDWINAYSRQGYAIDDSVQEDYPAKVPVYLYSNFPCSSYAIVLVPSDFGGTLSIFGFDSIGGGAQYTQGLFNTCYLEGCPESKPGNDSTIYLGDLNLKIGDFASDYNSDTLFSDTLGISIVSIFMAEPYTHVYCWGAADSISWSDIVKDTGGIVLPRYEVTFDAIDAEVELDGSVEVPIKVNPSYYTADYTLFLDMDTVYISLDSIEHPGGTMPAIHDSITAWLGSKAHHTIKTDPLFQIGKFALPDTSQTLFTLHFSVTDNFSEDDTTYVELSTGVTADTNFVYDWFSENDTGSKIFRSDTLNAPYFEMSDATIVRPINYTLNADAGSCIFLTSFLQPVSISELTFIGEDYAEIYYSGMRIDSVLEGKFSFSSSSWDRDKVTINLSEDVDTLGILANIWHTYSGGGAHNVIIETGSFIEYNSGADSAYVSKADTNVISPCFGPLLPDGDLPVTNSLSQNSPNPFNANTIINFGLSDPSYTSLEVFDVMGRKIKTVVSEHLHAGNHSIVWDGSNSQGSEVAAGIYFYVLKTDSYRETKKMLYLK